MKRLSNLREVGYEELVSLVSQTAAAGARAHLHTTPPGCAITESTRRGIVVELTDERAACAWFSDAPIEDLAKPLAVILHGSETVPNEDEKLDPATESVSRMADRMRHGHGHFHILNPDCLVNPHPGRWTIVFEDDELGLMESVSDERPLADIRVVERLIYET